MAAIVWTDVTALAPELSSVSVAGQTMILAHVNVALDVAMFGGEDHAKTKIARVFLAAYFGSTSISGASGASGPVLSESAGGLSRSYANLMTTGGSGLDRNGYGQMYRELVRVSPARAPLVI